MIPRIRAIRNHNLSRVLGTLGRSNPPRISQWVGVFSMNDDLIYVEPRQEAVLRYDDISVSCDTVVEAWLAWAQLDLDKKTDATIEVGDDIYGMWAIRGLRFYPVSEAA